MAPIKITGTHLTTVDITGNDGTWIVTKSAKILTSGTALHELEGSISNTIIVNGELSTTYGAFQAEGTNTIIEIGASGMVTGGVLCLGVGADVTNRGMIRSVSTSSAVVGYESGFTLKNYDAIRSEGGTSVSILDGGGSVTNYKGGVISGATEGLRIHTAFGEQAVTRVSNHGLIKGEDEAIQGGAGSDFIRNDGRMIGDIALLQSNDTLDNRGGKVTGQISGGGGDDTLITSNKNDRLIEFDGQGEDQVRSTVSYTLAAFVENLFLIGKKNISGTGTDDGDRVCGNSGNNTLRGLAGFDELDGKGGNDILIGGADGDRFYFTKGYDKDTLRGFQQGEDRVYIEDWNALSDIQDVKIHASNHGQDVWIKVGNDMLVIEGLHKADLTAEDFAFF